MKRLALILTILISLTFTACGASPASAVDGFLSAAVNGDTAKMAELCPSYPFIGTEDPAQELALYARMQFTVGSAVVDGDTATVSASLTTPDYPEIMTQALMAALQDAFASAFGGEEETSESPDLFYTLATAEDAAMITTDATFALEKVDGGWILSDGQAVLDALFGGMFSQLENFDASLSAAE